ncbi:ATP-binding protein [Salarchaeum japonicum]|uniref:ATP-binding protein n=1 Tax=Salarchaeum japonicum TaxID=555573 RepID=UPI003C74EB8F
MTHAVLAAKTGWGKSWFCQVYTEANLQSVEYAVVLDYKDEYRGLAKSGFARWMGVGDHEATLDASAWTTALEDNRKLILARAGLRSETWQEVAANVVRAAREIDGTALVVIDEAHFVAPQRGGFPEEVEGLATTGRGEGVSSLWVTQRPAKLDETILAQMDRTVLGGFKSDADLDKISGYIEYPKEFHNANTRRVSGPVPDDLRVDGEPLALRRFTDDADHTVGSEWIRSDDGDFERVDTRDKSMQSTHYGPEGHKLADP